jgi:hypothetical protein
VSYEEYRLLGCGAVWVLLDTDSSEEHLTSIFRVDGLVLSVLKMEAKYSAETSVLTRSTVRHTPKVILLM